MMRLLKVRSCFLVSYRFRLFRVDPLDYFPLPLPFSSPCWPAALAGGMPTAW